MRVGCIHSPQKAREPIETPTAAALTVRYAAPLITAVTVSKLVAAVPKVAADKVGLEFLKRREPSVKYFMGMMVWIV